jgi:hypothetical protein
MTKTMLRINPNGKHALDPCVGKEEMIRQFYDADISIDGIDIFDHGDYFYCNYKQGDFIDFYKRHKSNLLFGQEVNLKYDYFIANPPYNCHEVNYIKDNKRGLSKLFGSIGVHNMYSIFISAMIDSAKEGALISFISADSFLTARAHNPLREQIMRTCSVHRLILCPSDLFLDQQADVRTCIMILQKGTRFQDTVKVLNRPKDKEELKRQLNEESFIEVPLSSMVSESSASDFEFVVDIPLQIQALFKYPKIGELYKCITGISTGKDLLYIAKEEKDGFQVPFYKNPGSRKFYTRPDGYLTNDYLKYDKEVKNFMVRNKSFMLREGITCSSMGVTFGACYLPQGATFGVNANIFCDTQDIWWLLAYLNSSLVTYIVRAVLCRSNMITSGYVSKIPVLSFSPDTKTLLGEIAKQAYEANVEPKQNAVIINQIDDIIFGELGLPLPIKKEVVNFASNLQSRV